MKKKILSILIAILTICSCMFVFTACNDDENADNSGNAGGNNNPPPHVCVYDKQVTTDNYKATDATCTQKATYYLSCICGLKGEQTFEHGEVLGHAYTNYVYNNDAKCGVDGTETAQCDHGCGKSDTRGKTGSALSHAYGEWVSNSDGTHTRTCAKDATHKETKDCTGGGATCTQKAVCDDCGIEYGSKKPHSYTILKQSATQHWYECTCGAFETKENHNPGAEATETTDQTCTGCGYVITPALGHVHTLHLTKVDANAQSCTEEGNIEYYTCSCGKWFTNNSATTEITDKDSVVIEKDAHEYEALKKTATEHWWECSCGDKDGVEEHHGGNATCTQKAVCDDCGIEYGSKKPHSYTILKQSATQHWYECSCGAYETKENHNPGAEATETTDQTCTECGYVITPALGHVHTQHLTKVESKLQTCTEDGNIEYYTCSCEKWFTTDSGTVEITDKESVVIEKSGHNYATLKHNDSEHWNECVCGDKINTENHKGGVATCTKLAVCSVCNVEYGDLKAHDYKTLKKSATKHWNECVCGDKENIANHIPGAEATETTDQVCTECGYVIVSAFGHIHALHLTKVDANENTCSHTGNVEYYKCECGKYFEDEKALVEIENKDVFLAPHSFTEFFTVREATCEQDCIKGAYCDFGCGEYYETIILDSKLPHDMGFYIEKSSRWTIHVECDDCGCELKTLVVDAPSKLIGNIDKNEVSWRNSPLLKFLPYPSKTSVISMTVGTENTATSSYYGYASGKFFASEQEIDNYINELQQNLTFDTEQTLTNSSYQAYNRNKSYLLSVSFSKAWGDLSITIYKLNKNDYDVIPDSSSTHVHNYETVTVLPTAVEYGYTIFYCYCGDAYRRLVDPTGHNPIKMPTVAPTCSKTGLREGLICEDCGKVLVARQKLDIEHHPMVIPAVEPTCTATGLTQGSKCSECGIILNAQQVVAALGHNDVNGQCDRCDYYIVYTATFKADGKIIGTQDFTVLTQKLELPAIPEKKGHTAKWQEYTLGAQSIEINVEYTPIEYSVTYVLNGGANSNKNPTSYVYGQTISLYAPKNGIGNVFAGWYTEPNFAVGSAITQITPENASDLILYAKWEAYKIESAEGLDIDESGAMPTLRATVDSSTTTFDFRGKIIVSENCTFKVYGDSYGTVLYDKKIVPINSAGNNVFYISVFHPDGEYCTDYKVVIYKLHVYTYKFVSLNKTVYQGRIEENSYISEISAPNEEGYIFEYWMINNSQTDFPLKATKNLTITAKQTPIEYTIEYKLEGGDFAGTAKTTFTILDLPYTLVKANKQLYTFEGWVDSDGQSVTNITTLGDKSYTAVYTYGTAGVQYTTSGSDIIVTGYTGTDNVVGFVKGVTAIQESAFKNCTIIKTVIIPETVTSIGSSAFRDCTSLTSIEIPNSVTSIGEDVFYKCTSLTSVVIPDSVTSIGSSAFSSCTSLTKINYTGTIDQWAQIKFTYLSSNPLSCAGNLYINDELVTEAKITTATKINDYAFYGCKSLTSVEIGDSVTSIGEYAFYKCNSLISVEIGDSVTSIKYGAFYDCGSLISVVIGDAETSIGTHAFYNCKSLTSVVIGDSVTSIEYGAFYDCGSLTSITIPNSVTRIGPYAFYNCISLTSVTIGDSLTSIGDYAFYYCASLTKVNYTGTIDQWVQIEFGDFLSNPISCARNLYINDELVTEVVLTTATKINDRAFSRCSSLTSVVIGDSVTSIGVCAFEYCDSLKSVEIGDSVKSIGSSAFYKCTSLTIYCERSSKPSGWSSKWNYSNCPVIWGCKK